MMSRESSSILRASQTWAYGILGNHPLTWKHSLIVIMMGLTLTGNPQHVVVNFLDKDLSHGNSGKGSQANQANTGECYCEVGQEGEEARRYFEKEKCGLIRLRRGRT
ncbi:hypothetical protein Tco_0283376 [Tanacetum coccineum]